MISIDEAAATVERANDLSGEAKSEDYPATMALVGIGQALIVIAEALEGISHDLYTARRP